MWAAYAVKIKHCLDGSMPLQCTCSKRAQNGVWSSDRIEIVFTQLKICHNHAKHWKPLTVTANSCAPAYTTGKGLIIHHCIHHASPQHGSFQLYQRPAIGKSLPVVVLCITPGCKYIFLPSVFVKAYQTKVILLQMKRDSKLQARPVSGTRPYSTVMWANLTCYTVLTRAFIDWVDYNHHRRSVTSSSALNP